MKNYKMKTILAAMLFDLFNKSYIATYAVGNDIAEFSFHNKDYSPHKIHYKQGSNDFILNLILDNGEYESIDNNENDSIDENDNIKFNINGINSLKELIINQSQNYINSIHL